MCSGIARGLSCSSSCSRAINSDREISHEEHMENADSDETRPSSPPRRRVVKHHDDIKYASDGRIILYRSGAGLLSPTSKVRGAATDSFQNKAEPTGYNWKSVSDEMKEYYWGELEKKCCWDEGTLSTSFVRKMWERTAAMEYKDFVSRIKSKYLKGQRHKIKNVLPNVLESWIVHWQLPEVKAKSEQASRNRRSGPDGPGTGPVIHHGGSRNAELHALDLAKSQNIEFQHTGVLTIKRLHCVDGVWTDARAKNIYDEVMRQAHEERAPLPGTNEERIVTADRIEEIYREVSKVDEKGRMIGKGVLCQMYSTRCGQSSSMPFITQEARIQELEKKVEQQQEEMKAREEERTRSDAERDKEFGQLQRTLQQMVDFFSSSPAFESFTSQRRCASHH